LILTISSHVGWGLADFLEMPIDDLMTWHDTLDGLLKHQK